MGDKGKLEEREGGCGDERERKREERQWGETVWERERAKCQTR